MKEGWKYKKLGEVCEIERGGSPRPIKDFITTAPDGLNWIKIGDTDPQGKYIYSTKEKIKPTGLKKTRWVEVDDFLLSNSMSFGRPYILKTNGCIHDGWLVLRKYQQYLNADFFYYLLLSSRVQKQFQQKAQGSTVSNLNTQRVSGVEIAFPPLPDQQRIVSYLDAEFAKIEALKANAEKQLQAAKDLFQAALKELLTPKEGWMKKKLGDYATLITKGASPKWQGFQYQNSGIPFITSENVRDGFIDISPRKFLPRDFNAKQKRSILKKHDVLVNIVGASIGRAAIFDLDYSDANINQAVALVRCNAKIEVKYLCMFLNSEMASKQYDFYKKDSARANLSLENISSLSISCPSLSEQQRIADRLDALSANVKALQTNYAETITLCNDLKQALLKKVFG